MPALALGPFVEHVSMLRGTAFNKRPFRALTAVPALHPAAHEVAEQLLDMARVGADEADLMQAHRAMGHTLLWEGEFGLR